MANYNLKRIYEWPFPAQILIMVLSSFFIFYFAYFLDLSSIKTQTLAAAQQEDDLKEQYKLSVAQQTSVTTNLEQLPKMQAMLTQWENTFVTAADLSGTLDTILKYGENNQLKFNMFEPGTETKAGKYTMIPVKINMTGTYDQMASFMSEVANMKKAVIIGDFTLYKESSEENPDAVVKEPINSDTILIGDSTLEIYRK